MATLHKCRRAAEAGHTRAMVALGVLKERSSAGEDGEVAARSWRAAEYWYNEAANRGNKGAVEALGLLYQTYASAQRSTEAVELLIRSSSDPHLQSLVDGPSKDEETLEQGLAQLLSSENAQCLVPDSVSLQPQCSKDEVRSTKACVAFRAHDNDLFCDGIDSGNSRLSVHRSASAQTDATMLWTELPKPPQRRKTIRSRGSARWSADAPEQVLILSESRNSASIRHSSSEDEETCTYTSAQLLLLRGDALYFGHGIKADPEGAVKLYMQGMHAPQNHCYQCCTVDGTVATSRVFKYCAAAQLYHAPAMVRLSECYTQGKGVVKDSQEGLRWLAEAADANHPRALCTLAEHHSSGNAALGVAKDLDRAERLLRC